MCTLHEPNQVAEKVQFFKLLQKYEPLGEGIGPNEVQLFHPLCPNVKDMYSFIALCAPLRFSSQHSCLYQEV